MLVIILFLTLDLKQTFTQASPSVVPLHLPPHHPHWAPWPQHQPLLMAALPLFFFLISSAHQSCWKPANGWWCAESAPCHPAVVCFTSVCRHHHRLCTEVCLWCVHSREYFSSRWQLPKVLNTPSRERRSLGAFVLLQTDSHGFLSSSALLFYPVILNLLASPWLRWCRGGPESVL